MSSLCLVYVRQCRLIVETMSGPIDATLMRFWKERLSRPAMAESEGSARLEVNVIFTGTQGTLAALRIAGQLAGNLGARITLLVPQIVPYPLPITEPPVPVEFTERRFRTLAGNEANEGVQTLVHICLCRDRRRCLAQFLKPRSLVVIGGKTRWWPTEERRLALMLESKGHEVIFAGVR